MGMGEPLMNLDAVLGAAARLPAIGITHRRTGVSTVGWVPGIRRLTESDLPLRLALSLHAPDDALRSQHHAGQRPATRSPRCWRRARRTTRAGGGGSSWST